MANGKCLTSKPSLTFAVNVDLKVSIVDSSGYVFYLLFEVSVNGI